MSDQEPGFKLVAPFFSPAGDKKRAGIEAEEASRAADNFAKFLLPPSDEPAPSATAAVSPRGKKTIAVRLKITTPRGSRLPIVRLQRKSKGFVNIPLLRLVIVASAASAEKQCGRIGE